MLEAHEERWTSLRASELLARKGGRPRSPGEWGLAYLAFVNSGEPEVKPWHRTTPPELWLRAGFAATPGYQATYEAFAALEACEESFRAVAAELVAPAVEASGGKVGHAIHVDGTEAETHSRLLHDCGGVELTVCKFKEQTVRQADANEVREVRHREAEGIPVDDELFERAEEIVADERGGMRVKVNGCWYRATDGEAGIRAYISSSGKLKKFWHGYYNLKAVDHYTGGVLATYVCSASTQEYHAYPELYARAKNAIGRPPVAVVADRGFSVSSVFEAHTRDGVASVIAWRKANGDAVRKDYERYDRHGVPRCKHCGSETSFVSFVAKTGPRGEPRQWVRCVRPKTAACHGKQTILCKENWRLLVPLWRTTEAYQVLRVPSELRARAPALARLLRRRGRQPRRPAQAPRSRRAAASLIGGAHPRMAHDLPPAGLAAGQRADQHPARGRDDARPCRLVHDQDRRLPA